MSRMLYEPAMTTQARRSAATITAILAAARALFRERGFAAASIDEIAARAGVAKGAVYHHFDSKELIFARVFEQMTAELAARLARSPRRGPDLLARIGQGCFRYLKLIAGDEFRQILLLDGPAVLGWGRWREIDARYFGETVRAPLQAELSGRVSPGEIDALGHLIAGALTEAAMVCAVSHDRTRAARDLAATLSRMLSQYLKPSAASPASGTRRPTRPRLGSSRA
jgi:AcrR family transcriptional regulator